MDCTIMFMYWWKDSEKDVHVDNVLKVHDYIPLLSPAQYLDYELCGYFVLLHATAANCELNVNVPFSYNDRFTKRKLAFRNPVYGKEISISSFVLWNAKTKVERKPFKPLRDHPKTIPQSSKHEFQNAFEAVCVKTITQRPRSSVPQITSVQSIDLAAVLYTYTPFASR